MFGEVAINCIKFDLYLHICYWTMLHGFHQVAMHIAVTLL